MSTKYARTTKETSFEVGAVYEFRLVNNGLNSKAFTAVKAAFKESHGIGSPLAYARAGKWAKKPTAVFIELVKNGGGYEVAKDEDGNTLKPVHIAIEDLDMGLYVELDGGNFDLPLEYRLIKAAAKKDDDKGKKDGGKTKKKLTAAKKDGTKEKTTAAVNAD